MEMKKQMSGKYMFIGPSVTREHGEDFKQMGLAVFLSVYHISLYLTIVTCDVNCLPAAGALPKFLQAINGRA